MADEKCIFLCSRPGTNSPPSESNFGVKTIEPRRCEDNGVLAKTLFLSVDPYMRCRLNEDSGVDYLTSWKIGETLRGGGVGLVLESKSSEFKEGDIVQCFHWPWQTNAVFTKGSESWTSLSKVSNCSEFVCVLYKHAGKRAYFQFSSELRIQSGLRDAEHHQLMSKRDVFQNILSHFVVHLNMSTEFRTPNFCCSSSSQNLTSACLPLFLDISFKYIFSASYSSPSWELNRFCSCCDTLIQAGSRTRIL